MKKTVLLGFAGVIALATPGVAMAQDGSQAEPFVGVSAGYHEFDIGDDTDIEGIDSGSPIIGVVAGVDFPLSERMFAGVEANFHLGTDIVDNEYGASARIGFVNPNGAKFYARGGYQEVDFDIAEIANLDLDDFEEFDGIDTTNGDYLVGIGGDFPIAAGAFRVNLDTISFDTVRATTGYVLTF